VSWSRALADFLTYWLFRLEVWRDEGRWVRPRLDRRPFGGWVVPPPRHPG